MKKYKPLSLPQRHQIESLRKTALSQTQIASTLGIRKNTLCRELKSNTPTRRSTAVQYIERENRLTPLAQSQTGITYKEAKKRNCSLDETSQMESRTHYKTSDQGRRTLS